MATNVLPQLEEVISDLTEQESSIEAQLAEIRAKLEALRAVLPMFDESPLPPVSEPSTTAKPAAKKSTSTKTSAKAITKAKTSADKKPKTSNQGKNKKQDGRTAAWQKYTRTGVGKQPMPEAVRLILETQPEKDFKIAEVMSGLFKDEMPKSQYLKARNRISNILSGGVRSGDWFKGDRGAYRLTAKSN